MADDDLAQIRAARLAQLKQQGGGGGGGGTAAGAGGPAGGLGGLSAEGGDEEQKRKEESEARSSILSQILEPAASDRLGRIRLVKESRATDVENRLIMMARSGQLRQKVTEEQLKQLLGSLAEQQNRQQGRGEGKSGAEGAEEAGDGGNRCGFRVVRRGGWEDEDDEELEAFIRQGA